MLERASEAALFSFSVKFRFVRLVGGDDGIDNARQLVRGGDQCGGAPEFGTHAAVKIAEIVLHYMKNREDKQKKVNEIEK